MIRFVVGVVMALLALLGAYVLEGGDPLNLLGLSAFLLTFFMPLFAVLAVWRWKQWLLAWSHAFHKASDPVVVRVSLEIWKFSEWACYLAGLVGWMIGMVLIFGNVAGLFTPTAVDPVFAERMAHALGACLIGPIYGLLFGFICRILRARVEALQS